MADTPKYHPAFTITNVKSLIPITLDTNHGLYHSWAALFKVLHRVHDLTFHIIPPTEPSELVAYETSKKADLAYWRRLDAAVLNWIYGSISPDLLTAILLKDDTAHGAWTRLESMFQDNKAARASHLEQELADLDFENFSDIDGYCNHIKSLADCLADVDALIPETRLILKLTAGLPEAYAGTLAERTIKNRLAKENGSTSRALTALVSSTGSQQHLESSVNSSRSTTKPNKPKKSNSKASGKGRSFGSNQQQSGPSNGMPWQPQQGPFSWPSWNQCLGQWPTPPCPYPSQSWAPRAASSSTGSKQLGPGILGPSPQAYSALDNGPNPTPTHIAAAMQMLANPNQSDPNYYMDTGATSHMTADRGILSPYVNSSIKIIILLLTGARLMRCDSSGDLYPLFPSNQANSVTHSNLSVVSSDLWHNRLGHPDDTVLRSLSTNNSSGHCYYLLLLDDYNKFLWTYPITRKSQVKHLFQSFHKIVHTQFKRNIKTFQRDNGTEYVN
ncbi:uncharacterized protein LOC110735345, partial [Chenopodium quinoa]|uniref:uncharacterized protein LOC110735345 n=1 Tax=Chenopodium quinoa TaxID=63459 RepID=UPI000B7964F2